MSEHGTRSRYVGGCRCIECRAANARYAAELGRLSDPLERRARGAAACPRCGGRARAFVSSDLKVMASCRSCGNKFRIDRKEGEGR